MSDDVSVTLDGDHVATIELRRAPDNFIDVPMATAIADAIERLDADVDCRAIVLVSDGKNFCAGGRLTGDADDLPDGDHNPLYRQTIRLFEGGVPIVAAVQGAAIGAGLGLALAADFRVAAPEARFGATFAQLGFHPGFGVSATLPRVVGERHALDLLYTGRRVKGDEALALGLCDRLVPIGELRTAAHETALGIAASAPLAVRSIRHTLRGDLVEAVRRATEREHAEQQRLRHTSDFREGVRATSERRPARFTGS